jgi:hypothetical protein
MRLTPPPGALLSHEPVGREHDDIGVLSRRQRADPCFRDWRNGHPQRRRSVTARKAWRRRAAVGNSPIRLVMGAAGGVGGCDSAGSRVRARAAKLQPERRPRWSLIRFPAGDRLGAAPIRFGASARVDRRQNRRRGTALVRAAAQDKGRTNCASRATRFTRCASRGTGRTPGRSRSMRSGKPMSL